MNDLAGYFFVIFGQVSIDMPQSLVKETLVQVLIGILNWNNTFRKACMSIHVDRLVFLFDCRTEETGRLAMNIYTVIYSQME